MAPIIDISAAPSTHSGSVAQSPTYSTPDQTPASQLYADLSTPPPESKRHMVQEIYGLELARRNPQFAGMGHIVDEMLRQRHEMLVQELAQAPRLLNDMIHREVHHQLRARPDFQTERLVIEQWVPAIGFWLVCASHSPHTPWSTIIAQLQEGDPRRTTPKEQLEKTREIAQRNAARNEAAGDEKVLAAIDGLSRKGLAQFLEVERAIKTGETIVAHGQDLAFVESGHDQTRRAAAQGDTESVAVLSGTFQDGVACLNPNDNPKSR